MSQCPKCGCEVENPFDGKTVMHDVEACGSFDAPPGYADGGPAFPVYQQPSPELSFMVAHSGVSVRDYFAAAALQGMLSNPKITEHPAFDAEGCCNEALKYADTMLKARA